MIFAFLDQDQPPPLPPPPRSAGGDPADLVSRCPSLRGQPASELGAKVELLKGLGVNVGKLLPGGTDTGRSHAATITPASLVGPLAQWHQCSQVGLPGKPLFFFLDPSTAAT